MAVRYSRADVAAYPENRSFRASYDTTSKVVTGIVFLVFAVVLAATRNPIVGCPFVLILLGAFAYSPRSYEIAEQAVVVKRLIGSVRFRLDGIRELRAATAGDFRDCMRLWGNGGLFGYYGLFQTAKLGKSSWYVTNRRNAVILVTEGKTAVLSPDDVNGFMTAVRATGLIPASSAQPVAELMPATGFGTSVATWIGVLVALAVLAVVGFAVLYAPGPPRLTLTAQALTIHDRFYPVTVAAADVDMSQIRVIDLSTEPGWRPTARTNGFANAHYRSGWFKVANGQKVRLYSTGSNRLVLLPAKSGGSAVLVEASDPEKLVGDLRQTWGSNYKSFVTPGTNTG